MSKYHDFWSKYHINTKDVSKYYQEYMCAIMEMSFS
jgi:hypothetical protein